MGGILWEEIHEANCKEQAYALLDKYGSKRVADLAKRDLPQIMKDLAV